MEKQREIIKEIEEAFFIADSLSEDKREDLFRDLVESYIRINYPHAYYSACEINANQGKND